MSILSTLFSNKKRFLKITITLSVLFLIISLFAINYMAMRIASPPPSKIPPSASSILKNPAKHGLHLKSLNCLNGIVPTLVVEPDSTKNISPKAELLRQQLSYRGITLSEYGLIKGTVVILHGRSGRKENGLGIAERFCAAGLRCILIDLPSHGESSVETVKFGNSEWEQDLPFNILTECAEKFNFSTNNTALWGMSMGGSFATSAAADTEHGNKWDSITIVCSFDALTPVIKQKCQFNWLTNLTSNFCEFHNGAKFSEITPAKWAKKISTPTLVVHGDQDQLIPLSRGKKLYDSFASQNKKWLTVKGGTHDNILITPMPLYAEMADWILTHF